MPTIADAERVHDLALDLSQLREIKPEEIDFTATYHDGFVLEGRKFPVRHLAGELRDLLRRERDLQIAAIEASIRALGFDLEAPVASPTDSETDAAAQAAEEEVIW